MASFQFTWQEWGRAGVSDWFSSSFLQQVSWRGLSLSPAMKSQNIHAELENVSQAVVNLGGEE